MSDGIFRPVLHGDVCDLSRLLYLERNREARYKLAREICGQAAEAKARLDHGGPVSWFGNGSIMAAARNFANRNNLELPAEPSFDDTDYADCWITSLLVITTTRRELEADAA